MGVIRKRKGRQLADFVAGLLVTWGLRHDARRAVPGDTPPKAFPGQDDRQRSTGDHKAPADSRSLPQDRDARAAPSPDRDGAHAPKPALAFDREADPMGDALATEMRRLSDAIRLDASVLRTTDWKPLLKMLPELLDSGEASPFPKNEPDDRGVIDPLTGWDGVLALSCEQLQWLLQEESVAQSVAKEHGDLVTRLARFAFVVASERPPANATKGPAGDVARVEHTMLMRVDVLRMLISFLHQRERLGAQEVISGDVRGLLEDFIGGEDHCGPMCHLGSWVPFLHEYDPCWTLKQLPKIFPERADRRDLFVAAWTGYLYPLPGGRIFSVPEVRDLYRRGLALDPRQDKPHNPRQHDEYELRVADHLALACMEHDDFGLADPLLQEFLGKRNTRQLTQFVRFIGKRVGSRDPRTTDHMRKRLPGIWEWMLGNCEDPALFSEFGRWMAVDAGVMDPATLALFAGRTLGKSKGNLDWHYSLTASAVDLARAAPREMCEVADLFLRSDIRGQDLPFRYIRKEGSWLKATKVLLARDETGAQERVRLREIERMLQPDEVTTESWRAVPRGPEVVEEDTRAA